MHGTVMPIPISTTVYARSRSESMCRLSRVLAAMIRAAFSIRLMDVFSIIVALERSRIHSVMAPRVRKPVRFADRSPSVVAEKPRSKCWKLARNGAASLETGVRLLTGRSDSPPLGGYVEQRFQPEHLAGKSRVALKGQLGFVRGRSVRGYVKFSP
jgi:hypothetical protein